SAAATVERQIRDATAAVSPTNLGVDHPEDMLSRGRAEQTRAAAKPGRGPGSSTQLALHPAWLRGRLGSGRGGPAAPGVGLGAAVTGRLRPGPLWGGLDAGPATSRFAPGFGPLLGRRGGRPAAV